MNVKIYKPKFPSYLLLFAVTVLFALGGPQSVKAYNWPWDQGHDCVKANGGWGRWGYDGNWKGTYSAKECCEKLCKACPVYSNSGQLQKTYTDLTLPGVGPLLQLKRTYNSQDWATTMLGNGWTFNFGRKIIASRSKDGEKRLGVVMSTGEKNYFRENQDGSLEKITEYGVPYTLSKNSDGSYTIADIDGTKHELREDGKIAKVIDRNNNALEFTYNSVGCLTRITNASGNYVDFQIGPNGKIASMTDNFGRTVSYSYDDDGNLLFVTDPLNHTVQFSYNSRNLLTQVIDARGNTVESITYDSHEPPRVSTFAEDGDTFTMTYYDGYTRKTDSSGNRWFYYYNHLGFIERIVDPLGYEKKQEHNGISSTGIAWEEDLNGNRTLFEYDTLGNVTTKTDPLGNVWTYAYIEGTSLLSTQTDPSGVVTRLTYDTDGNLISITYDYGGPNETTKQHTYDQFGNKTSSTDGSGNVTTVEYNQDGKPTKITDALGNSELFTYDTLGMLTGRTDKLGHTEEYTYDLLGNLTQKKDKNGFITRYEYDENGNLISKTSPDGAIETYSYDSRNRLIKQTNAAAESTNFTYGKRFDSRQTPEGTLTVQEKNIIGHVIKTVTKVGDSNITIADSNDIVMHYNYDPEGNLLTARTGDGTVLVTNTYDANGRMISSRKFNEPEATFQYSPTGQMLSYTYNGETFSNTYNNLGLLEGAADSSGALVSKSYDTAGRLESELDERKVLRTIEYDSLGLESKVSFGDDGFFSVQRDANGKITDISSNSDFSIKREYDSNGRLTKLTLPDQAVVSLTHTQDGLIESVTTPNNQQTIFEYDGVGRRTKENYPDGTSTSYTFRGEQLTTFTNRASQTLAFGYDDAGLLASITPPSGEEAIQFSYAKLGSITQVRIGSHITSFSHDGAGRILSTTSGSRTITYQFNTDNTQSTANFPDNMYIARTFDKRGRLLTTSVNGNEIFSIEWTDSYPETISYANGVSGNYTYGTDGNFDTVTYHHESVPATPLMQLDYTADPLGFVAKIEDKVHQNADKIFERDKRGRITSVTIGTMDSEGNIPSPVKMEQWSYDKMNNWLSHTKDGAVIARIYDANSLLLKIGGSSIGHDTNGNIISDSTNAYTFDSMNNLTSVTTADAKVIEYTYDGLGRRISKNEGESVTEYLYDNNRLVAEYVNGQLHTFHVYMTTPDFPDDIAASRINGTWYYYVKDFEGNVVAVTDASGKIVEEYTYNAYGVPAAYDSDGNSIDTPISRHLFKGMTYDSESGLYYARSRYYNPQIGLFLTPDPLGWMSSGGTVNDYEFANSDPQSFNDPFGKFPAPSKQCSGHRLQFAVPNLGIFEKLIGSPSGEFLIEYKTCEKCCTSGINKGDVVQEKSASMTANIKWSSPCVPVVIPALPPLGWKTPGGACAGLFVSGVFKAGGSAFLQQDKCNDSYKGGGCIGLSLAGWLRGGYSGSALDAWAGGSIGGSGKVCLLGGVDIHVTGQACLSGKLAARIQLKKVNFFFIKKPYYEYTLWQGSWCTPAWEIL